MHKTTVYLPAELKASLRCMARDTGLADASIVVIARRHRTRDVLTLDERHFRVLNGPGGRPFRILPADTSRAGGR